MYHKVILSGLRRRDVRFKSKTVEDIKQKKKKLNISTEIVNSICTEVYSFVTDFDSY